MQTDNTNTANIGISVHDTYVEKLQLQNFRCYGELTLKDLTSEPLVLIGPNGAGKTNVLEAISLLAPGRGLRSASIGEFAKDDDAGVWTVHASLAQKDGAISLGTARRENGRVVRINGADAPSQTMLGDYVAISWLTPAMDRLLSEGSTERRRFFDRLVFQFFPQHATRLRTYEKALKERNQLLKQSAVYRHVDESWLMSLEKTLATAGAEISRARQTVAGQLSEECAATLPPFPAATLKIAGQVEDVLAGVDEAEWAGALEYEYQQRRGQDLGAKTTTFGVHRSDLDVTHVDKQQPAAKCSTGEQKALIVATLLAAAKQQQQRGIQPVLLLDEVSVHLDANRRENLYEQLLFMGVQVWLTGTDFEPFYPLENKARFFTVEDGQVTEKALKLRG